MNNTHDALIFDIDHFSVHDGEGIRTSIYFMGCPLSCLWCHSPESRHTAPLLTRGGERCTACGRCAGACPSGLAPMPGAAFDRAACEACGACAAACPGDALAVCGYRMSLDALITESSRDAVFFKHSGGGVTISGGECLMQPEATLALAEALHERGIDVIVETSGACGAQVLPALSAAASFYWDIKGLDDARHRANVGISNAVILRNLHTLRGHTDDITLRVPLIPGYNDGADDVRMVYALARELRLKDVHLLPYNASAGLKYALIGEDYPLKALKTQDDGYLRELAALAPPSLNVVIKR